MDQKSLFWKIKSTEKTLATQKKANSSFISNEEDEHEVHDQVSLSECSSKYNIAKQQVKITQEAIAESDIQKDLHEALQQKAACEERLTHLDTALKECTQQLHFARKECEKRVHAAIMMTSHEYEKTKIDLEEKLSDAGKKIARLDSENTRFKKSLLKKDKVVEELSRHRSQVEADLKALILRLDSAEKENASLKYEIRILEREIEIRHEEREFNQQSADLAQKQHKGSVEKIEKLESECQNLRLLIRKRLPGHTALTRMKNEVEGLEKRDQLETLRTNLNHNSLIRSMNFNTDVPGGSLTKRTDILNEQLRRMEEENGSLKNALNTKSSELQLPKSGQETKERGKYPFFVKNNLSDLGSDEKASCTESGTPSHRFTGTPEMDFMDDFAEVEKLAYSPAISEHVSQISEKNKYSNLEACDTGNENNSSMEKKGDQKLQSKLCIPIQKIIELLEGTDVISRDSGIEKSLPGKDDIDKLLPCKGSETCMVRVFRCETVEFSAVLQQFVQTCNGLLSGEADLEQFVQSVTSNFEWIMNHCFSLQDSNRLNILREYIPYLRPNIEEEVNRMNIKSANKESSVVVDLEGMVQSQIEKVESFRIQLQDSKDMNENSQSQVSTNLGDQTEEQKVMKQDTETQVTETNLDCRKIYEEISHPENDLENKHKSFTELEDTCNDQKTQLQGGAGEEVPDDRKQLQNDLEITSASEKLAECQETLRNLGKQLKALASPGDASFFDKVISSPADRSITSTSTPQRNGSQRLSLLDKMLAEDNDVQTSTSPRTKGSTQNEHDNSDAAIKSQSKFTDPKQIGRDADRNAVVSMAIVPRKKNGSFLKKLIWWKKKGNSKKTTFS